MQGVVLSAQPGWLAVKQIPVWHCESGFSLRKNTFSQGVPAAYKEMSFERKKIIITEADDSLWYPVMTVPMHEMRLYHRLEEQGIVTYLPVVPKIKVHNVYHRESSYRYEDTVLRPMLTSYIFARLNDEQRRSIWRTNSVRAVLEVSRERQPSFIKELKGLQLMEELAENTKVEYKQEIAVNDRFIIESPRQFEGTYGYLVERRKRFLWVIKLEILGGFVTAEIDPREYQFTRA